MTITSKTFAELFTVTRAGTATRVNASGLIETVAANTARIDYDPVTLACRGLLVEESRTNLTAYSKAFEIATWSKANVTISADSTTAPDGSLTADKLVASSDHVQHFLSQASAESSAFYVFTIYAKAAEETKIYIDIGGSGSYGALFDLSAGTATTGGGNNAESSIWDAGNGWYRCMVRALDALDPSVGYTPLIFPRQYGAYAGDGTSGIYVWGAQLEAGAFATSYIPTTAAAVTRNADVVTHTIIPAQYNHLNGTLFAEVNSDITPLADTSTFSASFTGSGLISMGIYGSDAFGGISSQFAQNSTDFAAGQTMKIASSISSGNCITGINGVTSAAQGYTPGAVPTTLSISGARCHVRKIKYSPGNQTTAELVELTT